MKLTKQELNDYLKQIKKLLVCDGVRRKEFMNSFEDNLEEYLKANPDTDFSKLQEEMGTPQEIANSFLENESAESIKKRMSVKKWVIIGGAIALLIYAFVMIMLLIGAYKNGRGYVEETITVESVSEDNFQEEIIEEEIIEEEIIEEEIIEESED